MKNWFKELDEVLRGYKSDPKILEKGTARIRIGPLVGVSIVLGVAYGLFMGLYAVLSRTPPCAEQLLASAVKVPALFLLTLVVTFPSLYVFSALLGVPLGIKDTFRLIIVPVAANMAVLASLGPITGFFTLCTTSYAFMKLLNVFFFAVSGAIGLSVLLSLLSRIDAAHTPAPTVSAGAEGSSESSQATGSAQQLPSLLSRIEAANRPPAPTVAAGAEGSSESSQATSSAQQLPRPLLQDRLVASRVFKVWVVIYALVGAQMGWVLRPFVGSPDLPFAWFRAREANIFADIIHTIAELLQ